MIRSIEITHPGRVRTQATSQNPIHPTRRIFKPEMHADGVIGEGIQGQAELRVIAGRIEVADENGPIMLAKLLQNNRELTIPVDPVVQMRDHDRQRNLSYANHAGRDATMAMMSGPKRQRLALPFLYWKATEQAVAVIVVIKASLNGEKCGGHVQGLPEQVCLISLIEDCRTDHFMEPDQIESFKGFRGSLEIELPVAITPAMDIENGDPETIVLPWAQSI